MSRRGAEAKPPWSAVPAALREDAERALGARVARAERVYGGYGPSATFRLRLADGRRAFFKGVNDDSNEFMRAALPKEERFYREVGRIASPWAPAFLGSFARDDWRVLLLEDVGPANVPPWTARVTRVAARSYAEFHRSTLRATLPRWLPRREHADFARLWRGLTDRRELGRVAALAPRRAADARRWLRASITKLRDCSERLERIRGPRALLHLDTRSDNVRVRGGVLRMFDWPFASVGPPEFDLAAFAQSVGAERGPAPEQVVAWYAEVLRPSEETLIASIAAIAGYFADRAWRPPIEGLPRLRSIQRRQLVASLGWAARALGLREPAWLAAVPD